MVSTIRETVVFASKHMFRLFIVQFIAMNFLLASESNGQYLNDVKVSLDMDDQRLATIFQDIEEQTDFTFGYGNEILKKRKTFTLHYKQESLLSILEALSEQAQVDFKRINSTISVSRAKAGKASVVEYVPDTVIKGKVTDENGEGLPGVTVRIKNTIIGTVTDIEGNYSLSVPEEYSIVIFSFVGYTTEEVDITGRSVVDMTMLPDLLTLQEVVVTGYFATEKESYTGTATVVSGDELIDMGGASLLDNLALVAPTVNIVQNNSLGSNPNAIPEIRIRGESVLNTNLSQTDLLGDPNLPLFIVDNFQVSVDRVLDMDQTRIESISVLRDASATALYGSRAANGVIVISTKKPQKGELLVTYNSNIDVDVADVESYNLLGAQELFDTQKALGMRTQHNASGYETREIERFLAAGVDTDWLAQPVRTAYGHRHSIGVQGGNDEIRYGVDAYYNKRPGVMKDSERTTYGALMNFMYYPSDKLTFTNQLEINFMDASESRYGSFDTYARMPGYLPIRNLDGSLSQVYEYEEFDDVGVFQAGRGLGVFFNPLYEAEAGNLDLSRYTNFINNFNIIWQINEVFRLQATLAYTRQIDETELFVSPFSAQFYNQEDPGTYDYTLTNTNRLDGSVRFNFSKDFNGHAITTNFSADFQDQTAIRSGYSTYGYTNDNPDPAFSLGHREGVYPVSQEATSRLSGFLGSLNYTYKGRYIADASYRMDGTSAVGAKDRYAPFWSAGVGWNMHNENFLNNIKWIDRLQLRATVGETGSISFAPYDALTTSRYYSDYRYVGDVGSTLAGLGNEDLRWQTTWNQELGIQLDLFKSRISVNTIYYHNTTRDMVTTIDAPPSLGFTSFTENLGQLENKGFELSLRATLLRKNDWTWNVNATGLQNKDRLLSIGDALESYNENSAAVGLTPEQYAEALASVDGTYTIFNEDGSQTQSNVTLASLSHNFVTQYQSGGSQADIWVVPSLGIDPMTGEEYFLTPEGEATTVYDPSYQVVAGNTNPTMRGNFGTSVGYKGLYVTMVFLYEFGGQVYNQTLVDRVENSDKYGNVDRRVLTQGWFEPGDAVQLKSNVTVSGTIVNQGTTFASSRFVQDFNYVQLSSINATYNVSTEWIKKYGFRSLRLQFNLNDIFYTSTVRRERGTDYPFARSFTFGLRAGF